MTTSIIVVALGGNALQQKGEAGADDQERVAAETASQLVPLMRAGHKMVIVHGNGPQVGNIVLHEEAINTPDVPTMPLDSSGAMSQGLIGYWLQQALQNELSYEGLAIPVVSLVTQTLVDKNDPAFDNPTKPIGPFYNTEEDAALHR
jgi:carbamate kinase